MRVLDKWNEMKEGWTGWIVYILLGVALALMLKTGMAFAFSTELPVVTVKSSSMVPNLNPGDIVFVSNTGDYQAGDVVVFKGWTPAPIIHRIVAKVDINSSEVEVWDGYEGVSSNRFMEEAKSYKGEESVVYFTKGDNNGIYDQYANEREPLTEEDIFGEKLLKVPYVGWVKLTAVGIWTSIF